MKTLIAILIMASFLQTTILPINLVLTVLICRAYIKSDQANLYLGFAFGLLLAHLNLTPLGLQSLIYVILIQITESFSRLRLAGNPWLITPITFLLLTCSQTVDLLILHQKLEFPKIFFESLLALPVLYLIKLWEERFIIRKEIKLKV